MNILFKKTKFLERMRLSIVCFFIALMASVTPAYTLTAYAAPNPTSNTNSSDSLLKGFIPNYITSPASGLAPGGVNVTIPVDTSGLQVSPDLSPNNPYLLNGIYSSSGSGAYGTSLGGGYGGGGDVVKGAPQGPCPNGSTVNAQEGCPGGSTGSGAAGVGGCAAGLLASILRSIGFSIAGATLGKGISLAGKGLGLTGEAEALDGAQVTSVPVNSLPISTGVTGSVLGSVGDAISNFFTAITENKSLGLQEQSRVEGFMGCIARSIARALIQQIAQSTINWINSGFNGSPQFVTNPTQFFQSVADKAAGNFLMSSDLAFLCSPFSLQVKIAIAQSYAGYNAPQCTLTQVVGNIQAFMNNFQNGGWPAFISMTSNPVNQPFGAYTQAQSGMLAAVANAQSHYQNQLTQGSGFLNFQQEKNCITTTSPPPTSPNKSVTPVDQVSPGAPGVQTYKVCDLITTTPGSQINAALAKTLGMSYDELNSAKYFDEIISALITQLLNKVLGGGGLLGLGSNYGNSSSDFSGGVNSIAQLQNNVLANIPVYIQSTNQVIGQYNQDILLVTPALNQASSTLACLQNANGYSGLTSDQQTFVTQNLPVLQATVSQLSAYLASYQTQLVKANTALTTLTNFQNQAGGASGIDNIEQIAANFTGAISASSFPDSGTVNGAVEDYGTLTSQLANMNQSLPSIAQQCQALGVPKA